MTDVAKTESSGPVKLDRAAMAADVAKMAEANAAKAAPTPAAPTGIESLPTPVAAPVEQAAAGGSIWDEALKQETPAPAENDPEDVTPEEGKKASGYQRLKQQNAELQGMARQFQQQLGQVAPEIQALREQNAALGAQLQMLLQGAQPKPDPNNPMFQLTQELRPEFQKELSPFDKRLQAVEQYNAQLQAQLEERDRQAERSKLRNEYTAATQAALQSVIFKDSVIEDQGAKDTFQKAVTLLALAEKTSPEEAARKLRRANAAWAQGYEKFRGAPAREKMQAQANVPRPAPESNTRAEGQAKAPSQSDLADMVTADGRRFSNVLKWRMAGSPQLFKTK